MAYNSNIPQAGDVIATSQPQLLGNFQEVATFLAINHAAFGSPNAGKHKWLSCPVQTVAPSFSAGENGFYNKLYGTTNKNELYNHKQTFSGTADIPFTASSLALSNPSKNTSGWTYLPSGIIMRWENGISSVGGGGLTLVTLNNAAAPAFTAIFSIFLTIVNSAETDVNTAVRLVNIVNTTQFRIFFSNRTTLGAAAGICNALIIGV